MSTHLDIETVSDDNQKSLFRSQRIKLSGKTATTPFRSIDPSKLRSDVTVNKAAFGFNEIYRELDTYKIALLQKSSVELDRFARDLVNLSNRGQQSDLTVCMVKFKPKQANPFPNRKEIEFITDVAHSYSDITPIPIVEARIDDSNFSRYLGYVSSAFDTIEELNQKPIMGVLPNLPREIYPKLLDFYLEKGMRAFYFDFNGQTPDHLKLRPVLRHLNRMKVLDKTLIYGINAKPGRVLKNSIVIPSKDFIAYGFGLDVLGESHVGPRLSKAFLEKMKLALANQQQNKKRIFMKSDYGYYKTNTKSEVSEVFPTDTNISLDKILHDTQRVWQKLFNMEQQAVEAAKIRKRLADLDQNESVLNYIREKTQIQKELKHLEGGRRSITKD